MRAGLRHLLQASMPALPMRGRHRLSDQVGAWLAPRSRVEVWSLNGINLHIDHAIAGNRRMYYGVYEMPFVNFLRRTLRPGDVFLDLGANIGYMTAVAHGLVGRTGRVIACEPSPTVTAHFRTDNPELPPGVEWLQAAVTEQDGTFRFCDSPRVVSHGFGRLLHGEVREGETVVEVPTRSVDSILAERGIDRVRCMKVDVEGAEPLVLKGAQALFERSGVDHVMVETTNITRGEREHTKGIFDLLKGHGMDPFLPDPKGVLRPFGRSLDEDFRLDLVWRRRDLATERSMP